MSQVKKKQAAANEVTEMKLRNAFKLIKQERYGAARHILRDFPEHPKALKMLEMIEGKSETVKAQGTFSKWGLFITFFVIIAIGGSILGAWLFNAYFSQFSLDQLFGLGLDGEVSLYSVASNYCLQETDFRGDSCNDWPFTVVDNYPDAATACFSPYRETFYLEPQQLDWIRACLSRNNAPAPN